MPRLISRIPILMLLTVFLMGAVNESKAQETVPNQLIVRFNNTQQTGKRMAALVDSLNITVVRRLDIINAEVWMVPEINASEAATLIASDPDVAYAQPDYILHAYDNIPNDPSFSQLWGMHNTGQTGGSADADIDAPAAWDQHTGSSVLIGVIDTGIDYNHPDLVDNIWTNPGEIAGNGIDDDGNGYVDDVHGWDFCNNDSDPMDDHYHGTHCAGTIAARGNNGIGVAGVCWSAKLMALKFLDSGGSGSTSAAIAAVEYATNMGVKLTSNSWGGTIYSQALKDAIDAANAAGQLFVAAAGNSSANNDSYPHYPSSYNCPNIIAVASTDHNDYLSSFSNYGVSSVDLAAPGSNIYSTMPNNNYGNLSGTSMACPHVAGAAALIWSLAPGTPASGIKSFLLNSVDPLSSLTGRVATGGRLNVNSAMALADPDDEAPSAVNDLSVTAIGSNWVKLSWTATGDDGTTGQASAYDIRFSDSAIDNANFQSATPFALQPAPAVSGTVEAYVFNGLDFDTDYYFAIKVADESGNVSGLSNVVAGQTLGVPEIALSPQTISHTQFSGDQSTHSITIENTADGILDWSVPALAASMLLSDESVEQNATSESIPRVHVDKNVQDSRSGGVHVLGAGGPDASGYVWIDSDESGGPHFQWNDISVYGTATNLTGDDDSVELDLPFGFEFYGITYSKVRVSSNGYLTFGSVGDAYSNDPIPTTSDPNALIAPFWDDLYASSSSSHHYFYDSLSKKLIVQYSNWENVSGGSSYTFQVHLCRGGAIYFYYKNMTGILDQATAGIENSTGSQGLQVAFNQNYFHNDLAVYLGEGLPDARFVSMNPMSGSILAGSSATVTLTMDAGGYNAGSYSETVPVVSNDPVHPSVDITVNMTVTGSPSLVLSADTLDFEAVYTGIAKTLSLEIGNNGTDVLNVTRFKNLNDQFFVDTTYFSLYPGQSLSRPVTLTAGSAGSLESAISIQSNDGDRPDFELVLLAEAEVPPTIAAAPSSVETTLTVGQSTDKTVTISNSGGSDLTFTIDTEYEATTTLGEFTITPDHSASEGPATSASGPSGPPTTSSVQVPFYDSFEDGDFDGWNIDNGNNTLEVTGATAASGLQSFYSKNTSYTDHFTAISQSFASGSRPQYIGFYVRPGSVSQSDGYMVLTSATGNELIWFFADDDGYFYINQDMGGTHTVSYTAKQWYHIEFRNIDWENTCFDFYVNGSLIQQDISMRNPASGLTLGRAYIYNFNAGSEAWWDGISFGRPDWLEVSPLTGTVAAGASQDLTLHMGTDGLTTSIHKADLNIASNDPHTPRLSVPVTMTVEGEPSIAFAPDTLDFQTVYVGFASSAIVLVKNFGSDVLNVSDIVSSSTDFVPKATSFAVLPGHEQKVVVVYTPSSAGDAEAVLTVSSDDPDTPDATVTLMGTGVVPPDISVSPLSVSQNLYVDGKTTETVTIENTGGSDLEFDIRIEGMESSMSVEEISVTDASGGSENGGSDIAAQAVRYQYTSGLADPTVLLYSSDLHRNAEDTYADRGLKLLGIGYEGYYNDKAGFNAALSGGSWELVVIDAPASPMDWPLIIDYINNGGKVVLSTYTGTSELYAAFESAWVSSINTLPVRWWKPGHSLFNYPESVPAFTDMVDNWNDNGDKVNAVGAGKAVAGFTSSEQAGEGAIIIGNGDRTILNSFLLSDNDKDLDGDGIGDAVELWANEVNYLLRYSGWVKAVPYEGTVPAGGSAVINLELDATGLTGGDYQKVMRIKSQDPDEPVIDVDVALHVTGAPNLVIVPDTVRCDTAYAGYSSTASYTLYNSGTDVLDISDISSSSGEVQVSGFPLSLDPQGEAVLPLTWTPSAAGDMVSDVTVTSNDPDENTLTFAVMGTAVDAPVISPATSQINQSLVTGGTEDVVLVVNNTGGSRLAGNVECLIPSGSVSAVRFDESDDFIEIADASSLDLTSQLTMACWIKARQPGKTLQGAFVKGVMFTGPTSYVLGAYGLGVHDNVYIFDIITDNGAGSLARTYIRPAVPDTAWHHVCGTFNNGVLKVYIDGQLAGTNTAPYSQVHATEHPLCIGDIRPDVGDRALMGDMDEARLYEEALTEAEVMLLYTGEESGRESALVGDWPFIEGNIGLDRSGKGNHGMVHGTVDLVPGPGSYVNWLSVSPEIFTTAPGGGSPLTVSFDATGMPGGDYNGQLKLTSNDPASPECMVDVTLSVTSAPIIAVSPSSIDFGDGYIGSDGVDTVVVSNRGFADLEVTNIASSSAEVMPGLVNFTLPPGGFKKVGLHYDRSNPSVLNGQLTISSNDPHTADVIISITGRALRPPQISVSPGSFKEKLMPGDKSTRLLSISNSGDERLDFGISVGRPGMAANNYKQYLLASRQVQGFIGEYKTGSTPVTVSVPEQSIQARDLTGVVVAFETYHTAFHKSEHSLLAADLAQRGATVIDISQILTAAVLKDIHILFLCDFTGPTLSQAEADAVLDWMDSGGSVMFTSDQSWVNGSLLLSQLPFTFASSGYAGTTTDIVSHEVTENVMSVYVYNAMASVTPQSGATVLVRDTNGKGHLCVAQYGRGRFMAVGDEDFMDSPIGYSDNRILGNNAIDWLAEPSIGLRWIEVTPSSGQVDPGNTQYLTVSFKAEACSLGTYECYLDVSSNDPYNPVEQVDCEMTVWAGERNIALDSDSLSFASVMVGSQLTRQLKVRNTGGDTLHVSGYDCAGSDFTTVSAAFNVEPGGYHALAVTFAPSSNGSKADILTIHSDDADTPDYEVALLGYGVAGLSRIEDLRASIVDGKLLLEWSEVSGASGYNVYRGPASDFIPDVSGGSNRIATDIQDEDSTVPGIQWTEPAGNGSGVGNAEFNNYYRVTATIPYSLSSLPGASVDLAADGVPHTVIGDVYNANGTVPANGDIEFQASIKDRPAEVLRETSPGCGFDNGSWFVNTGNFNTAWTLGDTLLLVINNLQNREGGSLKVELTGTDPQQAQDATLSGEVESLPSNVAGEFDVNLYTTGTTDINELVMTFDMSQTRTPLPDAESLAQTIPHCTIIYYWDAATQGTIGHPKGTPFNNFKVRPGMPYIVNVTDNVTWTMTGTLSDTTYALQTTAGTNINHIGLPFSKTDLKVAEDLGADITDCTIVYYWDAFAQAFIGHPMGMPFNNFDLKHGSPYYVNVTSGSVWPSGGGSAALRQLARTNVMQGHGLGGGVPHMVYGQWDSDNDDCQAESILLTAWIKGRESEVLTQEISGSGLDQNYWWVGVSSFPTAWRPGDVLCVELYSEKTELSGGSSYVLSTEGADRAAEILTLSYGGVLGKPEQFDLKANYPNPFNPGTTIVFDLANESAVTLKIMDMRGRLIKTLVSGTLPAGRHKYEWQGRDGNGREVAAGVYFYTLECDQYRATRKMMLLK